MAVIRKSPAGVKTHKNSYEIGATWSSVCSLRLWQKVTVFEVPVYGLNCICLLLKPSKRVFKII